MIHCFTSVHLHADTPLVGYFNINQFKIPKCYQFCFLISPLRMFFLLWKFSHYCIKQIFNWIKLQVEDGQELYGFLHIIENSLVKHIIVQNSSFGHIFLQNLVISLLYFVCSTYLALRRFSYFLFSLEKSRW